MSNTEDARDSTVVGSVASSQRRSLLAATAASLLLAPLSGLARADSREAPLAHTRSGSLRGYRDDGLNVFRGIPYAADSGAWRFRPAPREAAWEGIRGAVEFGLAAPQRNPATPTGEDCLRLNLITPGLRDDARRPVLVYIHGGGYDHGSGADPLYDGRRLCGRGDVVVITVNHRLNAFGYLHLGGFGDARFTRAGNLGQLDLIAALQWVQEHASEFGGDPGNVTLFGQSGGGAKIATLMAMPAARGLFHKAWTMSGQQVTAAGPRAATRRAERYLDALGVSPDRLDALLALPVERLVEATTTRDPSPVEDISLYFGPVLDGHDLPVHPFWPEAPAQSAQIPMVIGNTRDETRAFLGNDAANHALSWDELPARLARHQYVDLPVATVIAEYRRLYPHYTPSEVFFAATTAGRSWRGAVEELQARARQGAPTWAYQLDWGSPLDGGRLRAFHTLDIPLVFDTIDAPGSRTGDGPAAKRMADTLSAALLAFARRGQPQHPGLPDWPPYSLGQRETLVFDLPSRLEHDPRGGERRLYAQVPFVQRGTM